MTKLDINDAYYSAPICEDHQSLLSFQYQTPSLNFLPYPVDTQKDQGSLQNL